MVFSKMRIGKTHPLLPRVERGKPVAIGIDGQRFTVYEGETIAAVLAANGRRAYHYSAKPTRTPLPGFFCGMGICYGCLVLVDGDLQRACMITVIEGMQILTRSEAPG
jgi:predicted molibdopterin-dependent oxidoreductase YjgC